MVCLPTVLDNARGKGRIVYDKQILLVETVPQRETISEMLRGQRDSDERHLLLHVHHSRRIPLRLRRAPGSDDGDHRRPMSLERRVDDLGWEG